MFYSEDIVEDVRSRSDIVDVVGSYVKLTRRGGNYVGLCPFHNEKTASFSVNQARQMYHCFGCGTSGNVFTFLMNYENYNFPEALKMLAERAGVKLPEIEYSEEMKRAADIKGKIHEAHKYAAKFYYYLLRAEEGKKALEYLHNRGLTDETIKKFGLGFTGKYSDQLYKYLKKNGFDDELLKATGLILYDEKNGARDRFWNRVMFPIMDVNNKVIAFGGRVMGDGMPKYLNSQETKIFEKSRNQYAMNFTRVSRSTKILLCEGYMDVIALHQAGFDYAVASLGTAFTPLQANLLSRYVKEAIITYDSDGAGVKATMRAIPILRAAGISVKVLSMKPYKDPDEFIQALGAQAYQERIDKAENFFFFELSIMEKDFNLEDPQEKNKFLTETAKKLVGFTEELERYSYAEAVAKKYNVRIEDLMKRVNKVGTEQLAIKITNEAREQDKKDRKVLSRSEEGILMSQKLLLAWIADEKLYYNKVKKLIQPEDFTDTLCSSVAQMVYKQYENDGEVVPARIVNNYEEREAQNEIAEIFHAELKLPLEENERQKAFTETVMKIKKDSLEKASKKAIEANDMAALQKIINEQKELNRMPIKLFE